MEHKPLRAWCLRRVLLAGEDGAMIRAMSEALDTLGARIIRLPMPVGSEALYRTLHEGHTAAVIVPELGSLQADSPQSALDTLLLEAREAGVPLVMLLAEKNASVSPLLRHAQGCAQGLWGDPISVQCIRHSALMPDSVCLRALELGARFLMGDTGYTGNFQLYPDTQKDGPSGPSP